MSQSGRIKQMNQEDDASSKLLFSAPELVRDLVMGFIPDEWPRLLNPGENARKLRNR